MQKRQRQCGREIDLGFGQGHETDHIRVFGSRSWRKPETVLVNSILPGAGNSVGLAKKGERCPEIQTAVLKTAKVEVAYSGCRSRCSHRRESAECDER